MPFLHFSDLIFPGPVPGKITLTHRFSAKTGDIAPQCGTFLPKTLFSAISGMAAGHAVFFFPPGVPFFVFL